MADDLRFIDELSRPGMLHLEIVRSTIPRGSIASVVRNKLPEDCLLLSSSDLRGKGTMSVFGEEMPILSKGEIHYEGQPLFIIAHPKKEQLRECRRALKIDYTTDYSILAFEAYRDEQVAESVLFERGNVYQSSDSQYQIIEAEYSTTRESHITRAPLGALAYEEGEQIVIHLPTHWPHHARNTVAQNLGIERERVKILQCATSPAYGEKVYYPSIYAVYAALACKKSGKPARLLLSSYETLNFSTSKTPMRMKRTSTLDPEGRVDTEKVEILFDIGAFPLFSRELLRRATIAAAGYYSIPNFRIEAKAILTSTPPKNLYRGLGLSQSLFATETHFSRLAELAQHNPGEWKKEYAKTQVLPTGAQLKQQPLERLLEEVMANSDFYRKHAAYEQIKKRRSSVRMARRYLRGIGISSGFTGNGFTLRAVPQGSWNIRVRLDKKDQLTIYCGDLTVPETIQGIWRERVKEILGVSPENVEIAEGDTNSLPDSGPLMLSTATSVYTNLVDRCCRQIRKERFHNPLPLEVKRGFGSLKKGSWDEKSFSGNPFPSYSWCRKRYRASGVSG